MTTTPRTRSSRDNCERYAKAIEHRERLFNRKHDPKRARNLTILFLILAPVGAFFVPAGTHWVTVWVVVMILLIARLAWVFNRMLKD